MMELNSGLQSVDPRTDPNALVPVLTWVPASQVLAFQEGARRLVGAHPEDEGYTPPFPRSHGPKNAWELAEWERSDDDLAAAAWIIEDLGTQQQMVLAGLIAWPRGLTTGQLLRFAGYPRPLVAAPGVMKAIAGRFRATGHRPVWNGGERTDDGQRLPCLREVPRLVFHDLMDEMIPDVYAAARLHADDT